MAYDWEVELPPLAAFDDAETAAIIEAMIVQPPTVPVFGSFRTLAGLLTQPEYNTLRAVLKAASDQETAAGGTLIADMIEMLKTPGDEHGNGGGLDFTSPGFIAMVDQLSALANIPAVPGKIAAHVASEQPKPVKKYPGEVTAQLVKERRAAQ